MTAYYLAIDLGAESGRVMLGTLTDDRLGLEELHRFANVPLDHGLSLTWDLAALFREIKAGLAKASQLGLPIDGVSVDSWGVDYVLLDDADNIMPRKWFRVFSTGPPDKQKANN